MYRYVQSYAYPYVPGYEPKLITPIATTQPPTHNVDPKYIDMFFNRATNVQAAAPTHVQAQPTVTIEQLMKELAEKDRIIAQKNKEISDLENELSRVQRDLYDANYHLRQIDDNVPIRERYENFDPDYRFRRR